jgi:hypothetical protein
VVPVALNAETVRDAPKVLLHDHLDGGLRPATVVELAEAAGYRALPTTDVDALGRWFLDAAHSGSLVRYLETFGHTVGVMQTADALVRVAAECAEDLADDGVVYAEVRFAPELHVEEGLDLAAVVGQVLGALGGHADQRVGGLHDGHGVPEGLQVAHQRAGVGGVEEPAAQRRHVGGGQRAVADGVGELDHRGGAQAAVEMIVEQHLGRVADGLGIQGYRHGLNARTPRHGTLPDRPDCSVRASAAPIGEPRTADQ